MFEKHYYLAANPDVRAARIDPVVHYLKYGTKEGRSPNPFFRETAYLERYPDVVASGYSAIEHYERFGRAEGRRLLAEGLRSPSTDRLEPETSTDRLESQQTIAAQKQTVATRWRQNHSIGKDVRER